MKKFTSLLFFGNVFYGLCTVALSIETNLQLGVSLNRLPFYLLIFLATIVYYGRIYYKTSFHISSDERSAWFRNHRNIIRAGLIGCTLLIGADILYMLRQNFRALFNLPIAIWLLIFLVPLIGVFYTFRLFTFRQLRQVGWLKPFIIGFVWAGIVTIFPFLFWQVNHPFVSYGSLVQPFLFWLQNLFFITALAIVFDIKDYEGDKKLGLFTIPARLGTITTICWVIIPMCLLSFAVLNCFLFVKGFAASQYLLQCMPYVGLLYCLRFAVGQNNLLFYLAAIDGLMLLKAICGIISNTFL